jgi:phage terminase large subunit
LTGLNIETPEWAEPIFSDHYRYIGIRGGRASGKSHFLAEYFIERSLMSKYDLVCAREFQSSLKNSVKKLLEDKIAALGVGHCFDIQRDCIKSKRGGQIVFLGIADSTAESLKSVEGFDGLWYEESQVCSQRSLDLIRPTIRKKGSQLFFTWNPRFETDPVDQFFLGAEPPPESLCLEVNYVDNPWFPDEMLIEMEYDKKRDIDKYNNIWLGRYLKNTEARIFKHWKIEDFEAPRGTDFKLGADFGFGDATVLVRCFLEGRKLYIDQEAYMRGCEVHDIPALFMTVPDSEKWPIVADSSRPDTISHLRKNGFPAMMAAVKGPRSVEEGLTWLKSHDIIVHPRCVKVIEELAAYKYKTNAQTGEIYPVPEDKNNHCIAEGVLITCERGEVPMEQVTTNDKVLTRGGYRKVLFSDITDINRKILRVETTGGTVFCTPDHKIFTSKGFVRADALSYNDEVINLEEPSWQQLRQQYTSDRYLGATQRAKGEVIESTLKNQLLEVVSGFTDKFGLPLLGRFLKGIMSITKMATRSIMTFQTLNALARKITLVTGTSGMKTGSTDKQYTLKEYESLPSHGTPVMKAESNMPKSAHKLINNLSQLISRVNNVMKYSRLRKLGTLTYSAPIPANQSTEGFPAWMMNNVNAHNAARPLQQISTPRHKLVPGRVLTVTEHGVSERVYDLTVEEHHEFFANGVLVLNCIDSLRYACEGLRRAKRVSEARAKDRGAPPIPCYSPYARK